MTIYDIDARIAAILSQVDAETGEIPEEAFEELDALADARETKIENAACSYINYMAEAAAIREQEKILAERRRKLENTADGIKRYVERATAGEPFESPRVQVKYRKSRAVEIDADVFFQPFNAKYIRFKEPEPDKDLIKKDLKAGMEVPGAALVERMSMSIPFSRRKKEEEEDG